MMRSANRESLPVASLLYGSGRQRWLSAVLARRQESNVEARRRAEADREEISGKEAFLRAVRVFFGIHPAHGAD